MKQINALIVDRDQSRGSLLKRSLKEYGHHVVARVPDGRAMFLAIEEFEVDVIVIGIELPDEDTLADVAKMSTINPHPVVMFAEKDAPQIIQKVIQSGVSTFIIDDIQPQRITSIIQVAMARFNEMQQLRNELEDTKTKLADRKVIDKAKGLIMSEKGIDEEEAYKSLRKMAMDKGQNMAVVAQNIIDVFSLMNAKY